MSAALEDTGKAIDLNPYFMDSLEHRWLLRRMQGDLDGASTEMGHAIELRGKEISFYFRRGFTLGPRGTCLLPQPISTAASSSIATSPSRIQPGQHSIATRTKWSGGRGFPAIDDLFPDSAPRVDLEKEYLKKSPVASPQGDQLVKRTAALLRRGDFSAPSLTCSNC